MEVEPIEDDEEQQEEEKQTRQKAEGEGLSVPNNFEEGAESPEDSEAEAPPASSDSGEGAEGEDDGVDWLLGAVTAVIGLVLAWMAQEGEDDELGVL